jgi:Fe-S cluster biosynthesis and repair protein YggX
MEGERFVWYNTAAIDGCGVAAPVRRLLAALASELRTTGINDGSNGEMRQARRRSRGSGPPALSGRDGQAAFRNVSKTAWQQWLRHQTMLINEYRLTPFEPKARQFLEEQMDAVLFRRRHAPPEGYVPPRRKIA